MWESLLFIRVGQHQDHGLDQLHTKAIIYFNGKIQWMSPTVKKLSCRVDMTFFPRDIQVIRIIKSTTVNTVDFIKYQTMDTPKKCFPLDSTFRNNQTSS